jgi:hypothetical protein
VLEGDDRLDDLPSKRARVTASFEGQGASDALLGWARILAVIILGVLAIWWWL